jgi:hypothetical protein
LNIYIVGSEDGKVFGVGQTTRSFADRHKDGDWAKFHNYLRARGEKLVLIGWWKDTTVLDTEIHKFLLTLPHIRKYAEWFSHKTTLDIIKHIIAEKFFTKTPEKKETLTLAKHQKEFVAKAGKEYLEFLLFAKCRAGKSVMTLSHIVDSGFKVTLIVSMFKSPMQSWNDDIRNFRNFDNLVFIDISKRNYIQQIEYWYNTDKQLILWACVQSRKTLNLPIDIDLLVFDEADHGYDKGMWNKLREATKCPVLYVTGTAYKMVWDFNDPQRYIYSYYEEQLDKRKGLNKCPSMKVILAKYYSAQYQAIFGDDPDAMKNLFNVDDEGNFIHPELVQEFVSSKFIGDRNTRSYNRLFKDATHLYIALPSIKACDAFAKYMKSTRFAPLVAHGDAKVDSDAINKHIKENPNGSCIITVGANVRGVTAKEVDTIVNCAEGSSIEFWTQFAFRGGSGEHDWQVIDFCPQRCLESIRQTYVAACDSNPEVAQYNFTDYVCITEWENGFTELTADQVNEILAADVGNAIRLVSSLVSTLDYGKLRDLDFNLDLEPSGTNVVKRSQLNDNGANGKSNWVYEQQMTRSEKDEIYGKIDTVQSILERIPLVLYHAIESGELMNSIDSVLNSPHYKHVTLDDENIIEKALDQNILNRERSSRRISTIYTDIQYAIKEDDVMALVELSKSAQSHKLIPVELFESMLEL